MTGATTISIQFREDSSKIEIRDERGHIMLQAEGARDYVLKILNIVLDPWSSQKVALRLLGATIDG